MALPIFRSVSQALYVAFVMEGMPISLPSPTQMVYRALCRLSGQSDGSENSLLNLERLTPLEFHQQCADIRTRCSRELPAPELFAVWARYGQHVPEDGVFTLREGLRGLADYVGQMCSAASSEAMLSLTAWNYVKQTRLVDRVSMADIAQEYGMTLYATKAVVGRLRETARQLEGRALDRMAPRLIGSLVRPDWDD